MGKIVIRFVLWALFMATWADADMFTLTSAGDVSVNEGSHGLLTFTVTNTGAVSFSLNASVTVGATTPDPSDFAKFLSFDMTKGKGNCSNRHGGFGGAGQLAPTESCTYKLLFGTAPGAGEAFVADDGTTPFKLTVVSSLGGTPATHDATANVVVTDTPEPDTVELLVSNVLLFVGLVIGWRLLQGRRLRQS